MSSLVHWTGRLWARPSSRWAIGYFSMLVLVDLMADFLANDKPLYCKLEGKVYFPVFDQYLVQVGLTRAEGRFLQEGWYEQPYEYAIFPPIPYAPGTIDRRNLGAKSPFGPQRTGGRRKWHLLGTDLAGHDVAAGLIHGARKSILIGLIGMLTATVLGIFFGALAGFYGDYRFRSERARVVAVLSGAGVLSYLLWAHSLAWSETPAGKPGYFSSPLFLALGVVVASIALYRLLKLLPWGRKQVVIPFDFWTGRLMETLNAVPALLLILAVLAAMDRPSIYIIMGIIGLVRWTGIARLVRAELLKVSSLPYIESATALGYSSWRILLRHALPNSLGPVWVTLAFGMAGAILIEASLSFLGVGLPVETVTWGSLMRQVSSTNIRPWWLAVFPGLAIFLTVLALNKIGEALSDIFDPRRKGY